jgi:hypothetical protein
MGKKKKKLKEAGFWKGQIIYFVSTKTESSSHEHPSVYQSLAQYKFQYVVDPSMSETNHDV